MKNVLGFSRKISSLFVHKTFGFCESQLHKLLRAKASVSCNPLQSFINFEVTRTTEDFLY
jgi:hypothetical protein